LGDAYLKNGDEEKAIETFKKALDKDVHKEYTSDILVKLSTQMKS
jgi:pentatricopeptide repeat protein